MRGRIDVVSDEETMPAAVTDDGGWGDPAVLRERVATALLSTGVAEAAYGTSRTAGWPFVGWLQAKHEHSGLYFRPGRIAFRYEWLSEWFLAHENPEDRPFPWIWNAGAYGSGPATKQLKAAGIVSKTQQIRFNQQEGREYVYIVSEAFYRELVRRLLEERKLATEQVPVDAGESSAEVEL